MNYRWLCDRCHKTGVANVPSGTDVMSGARIILGAHYATSPKCEAKSDEVRVVNQESEATP